MKKKSEKVGQFSDELIALIGKYPDQNQAALVSAMVQIATHLAIHKAPSIQEAIYEVINAALNQWKDSVADPTCKVK